MRTVVWFSCGASSAVAAKLVLAQGPAEIVYTDPGSEHPDNKRFMAECEEWFGQEVTKLKSEQYEDTWDVWAKTNYLVGPQGARCTAELKRKLRFAFQQPDDRQVFGYTVEPREQGRAALAEKTNPEVDWWWPLIEMNLNKADCLAMIERAGIELPAMYKLGYDHNNCIGCPKGAIGYWNKIRVDFPVTFHRMAVEERRVGHACNSEEVTPGSRKKTPVWLDELDPARGDYKTEPEIECSIMCQVAESTYAA